MYKTMKEELIPLFLSKDRDDFNLAINILENQGYSQKDIVNIYDNTLSKNGGPNKKLVFVKDKNFPEGIYMRYSSNVYSNIYSNKFFPLEENLDSYNNLLQLKIKNALQAV